MRGSDRFERKGRGRALRFWLAVLSVWILATSVEAQWVAGEIPLADVLEVLVIDREILAIDAAGGGQTVERLRLAETVIWKGARGKIGVVITDQRILAASTQSGSWQETNLGRVEIPPETALLGERVALLITSERALGFDGGSGNLVEYRLGVDEPVLGARVGSNVAVVVTGRQALGLSPFVGGFFRVPLKLRDPVQSIDAESNLATLTTARTLMIFRATTGSWEKRSRDLR